MTQPPEHQPPDHQPPDPQPPEHQPAEDRPHGASEAVSWQQQAEAAGWTPPMSPERYEEQQRLWERQWQEYWQQHGYPQPGRSPYGDQQAQPQYAQPQYAQPQYAQPQYAQPQQGYPSYGDQQAYPQQGYAPQPYPAQPPRQAKPSHPHPEPRTYDQMLRTWNYAWWRPLVGLLLLVVGVVVAQLVLFPVLLIGAAFDGEGATYGDRLMDLLALDTLSPSLLLYVNLGLAAVIPLTWLVLRVMHGMRPRWLASVRPFLRWRLFWTFVGFSVICLFLALVVGALVPGGLEETGDVDAGLAPFTGQTVALLLIVLLTTPLQAAGEEYGFRGYGLQAISAVVHRIGSGLRLSDRMALRVAQAIAILLTSTAFAFAHGSQNFPLFFDRFAFGVIAGISVIIVGGLEAAIAMHVVNNLVAFGLAIAFGAIDDALTVSEVSWWRIPVTVVQHATFLALVWLVVRRGKVQRLTDPDPGPGPTDEREPQGEALAARS